MMVPSRMQRMRPQLCLSAARTATTATGMRVSLLLFLLLLALGWAAGPVSATIAHRIRRQALFHGTPTYETLLEISANSTALFSHATVHYSINEGPVATASLPMSAVRDTDGALLWPDGRQIFTARGVAVPLGSTLFYRFSYGVGSAQANQTSWFEYTEPVYHQAVYPLSQTTSANEYKVVFQPLRFVIVSACNLLYTTNGGGTLELLTVPMTWEAQHGSTEPGHFVYQPLRLTPEDTLIYGFQCLFNGTSARTQSFAFSTRSGVRTGLDQSTGRAASALEGSVLLPNYDPLLSPAGQRLLGLQLKANSQPLVSPFADPSTGRPFTFDSLDTSAGNTERIPQQFQSVPSGSLVWLIESAVQVTTTSPAAASSGNAHLYRISVFPSTGSALSSSSSSAQSLVHGVELRYRLNEGQQLSVPMEGSARFEHGWITVYPSDVLNFAFTYRVRVPAAPDATAVAGQQHPEDHVLAKVSPQFAFNPIQGGPYFGLVGSLVGGYDSVIASDLPWTHCNGPDFGCQFSNGCAACVLDDKPGSCGLCLELQACQTTSCEARRMCTLCQLWLSEYGIAPPSCDYLQCPGLGASAAAVTAGSANPWEQCAVLDYKCQIQAVCGNCGSLINSEEYWMNPDTGACRMCAEWSVCRNIPCERTVGCNLCQALAARTHRLPALCSGLQCQVVPDSKNFRFQPHWERCASDDFSCALEAICGQCQGVSPAAAMDQPAACQDCVKLLECKDNADCQASTLCALCGNLYNQVNTGTSLPWLCGQLRCEGVSPTPSPPYSRQDLVEFRPLLQKVDTDCQADDYNCQVESLCNACTTPTEYVTCSYCDQLAKCGGTGKEETEVVECQTANLCQLCWFSQQAKVVDEATQDQYPVPKFCSAIQCQQGPPVMSGDSPYNEFCDEQDFSCELEVSCSFCLSDPEPSKPFDGLSDATKAVLRSGEHCMHCTELMACSEEEDAKVGECQMEVLCEQCHFFLDSLAVADKLDWSRLPDYCFAVTGCDIQMTPEPPGPAPPTGGPDIPDSDCDADDPQCEVDYSCKYCKELATDPAACETRCKELKACDTGSCQLTALCELCENWNAKLPAICTPGQIPCGGSLPPVLPPSTTCTNNDFECQMKLGCNPCVINILQPWCSMCQTLEACGPNLPCQIQHTCELCKYWGTVGTDKPRACTVAGC